MNRLLISVLGLSLAGAASAGGYRVSLQGQKALAMGHTGVALSESSEVVFFNPGAMTQLQSDTDITGGLTLLAGSTIYEKTDIGARAETDNPLGTPINGYMTQKISDELTWGLGIYTPYGNKVEWPTDWQGSHLVNYIELQAIYIQPTIGYQINNSTSVGFGPTLVLGSVEFNRNLSTSLTNANGDRANVTIEAGNVTAWGYNMGIFTKISEQLNFGASYRSEVTVEARNEKADFSNIPTALAALFPDGQFDADLPLPAELTLGLAYALDDKTTLAFDFNRTFWDTYENLTVIFDAPGAGTSVNPRNYKDSSIYRFGVQHQYNDQWILRGGIYFDESPVRDGYFAPETPRNDSIGYTAGASYQYSKNMELDFSVLLLTFDKVTNSYDYYEEGGFTVPFGGAYESSAYSFGFGLSYKY